MPPFRLFARRCATLAAVVCSALAEPARAATVSGVVASPSIVWIAGAVPRTPLQDMHNLEKSFIPELLVVPVGGVVRFPNDDPFFHSIYSSSDGDPFDIGFYETGPGKEVTFERAGILEVRCHIHARMHATIVVVDGPYQRVEGAFSFGSVGRGEATISAWNAIDGLRTRRVRIAKKNATVTLPHEL